MDAESEEKLVNIFRSTLYLVKHYGKHVPKSAALLDMERTLLTAIAELEAAHPPDINGGSQLRSLE
jgi:hypothetical protein